MTKLFTRSVTYPSARASVFNLTYSSRARAELLILEGLHAHDPFQSIPRGAIVAGTVAA